MQRLPCRGLLVLALLAAAPRLAAQDEEQLRAQHAEKLGRPFAGAIPWFRGYAEAREAAKRRGKLVLVYFTRSDERCPACDGLEKDELLEAWWIDAAKGFVPYLHVTTGIEGLPDERLFVEKGGSTLPSVVLLDPSTGAVLDRLPRLDLSPKALEEALSRAKDGAAELKKLTSKVRARSHDPKLQAALKLKLARLYAGDLPLPELPEVARSEGLDPVIKAAFEAWYPERRVQLARLEAEAKAPSTAEERLEVLGAAYYGLLKEGVRLPGDHPWASELYLYGLRGAVRRRDRAVAQAAYAGWESTCEQPALAGVRDAMLKTARKLLEELDQPPQEPPVPPGG